MKIYKCKLQCKVKNTFWSKLQAQLILWTWHLILTMALWQIALTLIGEPLSPWPKENCQIKVWTDKKRNPRFFCFRVSWKAPIFKNHSKTLKWNLFLDINALITTSIFYSLPCFIVICNYNDVIVKWYCLYFIK